MKYALFDLDGTLNGNKGRDKFIPSNVSDNAAWLDWHKAFRMERLNDNLIKTAQQLYKAGYGICIVSNRDHSLTNETHLHLKQAGFPPLHCAAYRQIKDGQHPEDWKYNTIANMLLLAPEGSHVMHFDDDYKAQDKLLRHFTSGRVIYTPIHVVFQG